MKKIKLKPRKMSLNLKRSYVSNLLKTYMEDLRIRRKIDELPTLSFHIVMHLFLIDKDLNSGTI